MNYITGDLLEQEGVLVHQVNASKKMGAGLAKQVRDKWPIVYDAFMSKDFVLGDIQLVRVDADTVVCNLCAQTCTGTNGRKINYHAFSCGLRNLKDALSKGDTLNHLPVFFPYLIGCGLAGGSWAVVSRLLEDEFPDATVVVYYSGVAL